MKRLLFLITFLFISAQLLAQEEEGMHFFHGSWAELKAEAKKQNKPIIVDCFTTWCGPCRNMSSKIFPRKEVGDYYNANFICYKLDMEKREGPQVSQLYQVESYPTYLFFSPEGKLIHRAAGAKDAMSFIQDGKRAIDPEKSFYARTKKFESGNYNRDTALLQQYILTAQNIDRDLCEEALAAYWKLVSPADLGKGTNWVFFRYIENDVTSFAYQYVMAHKEQFAQYDTAKDFGKVLAMKAVFSIQMAANRKDPKLFKAAKAITDKSTDKEVQAQAGLSELLYYKANNQWKEYLSRADEFVKPYGNNTTVFNYLAYDIANNTDDKKALGKAEEYAKKALAIERNYINTDTYAHVLYKLGNYQEAEKIANDALQQAQAEGQDATSTNQLLSQIKEKRK